MQCFRRALVTDPDISRHMLQGIDINMPYANETHLQFAVHQRNLRAVELLLELGADRTRNVKQSGSSLLLDAIRELPKGGESYDVLKLLLETGSDCNERFRDGTTPLLYTLRSANVRCAKLLLEYGADMTAVDISYGYTALHFAAMNRDVAVAQFVLDQGFDVECNDNHGRSALNIAVVNRNLEVCELLLRNGADVNRRDGTGKTSLMFAVTGQHTWENFVRVLLDYGADVTAKFGNGTILQFAMEEGRQGVIQILIRQQAQMESLHLDINESDRKLVKSLDDSREYYEKCLQEIEDMKGAIFYNSVSIFHLFVESKKLLSGYARNEELIQALEMKDYKKRFPIYSLTCLTKRFYLEVVRQKLRKTTAEVLSDLFKFNDHSHIVVQKILSYISDDDLKYLEM